MTQQNEVQMTPEQLQDRNDTLENVLRMKENRITQLETDLVSVSKQANKTIGELTEQIEDLKKADDVAELNGVGELVEVTS
ncbi:viral A-type inclusion protein [uncultured Mediterranean phage uvDeep-CGR2-KM18-C74]|nr:viral A-type inclusion protein [uncultured Mediterranean phage uvDeep-CGR2-KM18-C74]